MADPEVKETESTETENQGESTETENQGVVFDDGQEVETETQTPEGKEVVAEKQDETINQEAVDKKISKLTFKRHEEREKREAAEAMLAERDDEIKRLKGESDKVVVPPLPDPYDENYQQLMREREDALQKQATITAQQELEAKQQKEVVEQQYRDNIEKIQKNVSTMYESAEKFGFEKDEFKKAELQVSSFIKQPDVANYILESEDSSLIVQYLYNNSSVLDKVSRMSPVNAAVFIATEVTPKAQSLKSQSKQPPEPLEIVKGKGGGEKKNPYLDGVVME